VSIWPWPCGILAIRVALRAQNLWSVSVNKSAICLRLWDEKQNRFYQTNAFKLYISSKSMHSARWHRTRTPRMASTGSLYKETCKEALRIRKFLESASANHRKFHRDCFSSSTNLRIARSWVLFESMLSSWTLTGCDACFAPKHFYICQTKGILHCACWNLTVWKLEDLKGLENKGT